MHYFQNINLQESRVLKPRKFEEAEPINKASFTIIELGPRTTKTKTGSTHTCLGYYDTDIPRNSLYVCKWVNSFTTPYESVLRNIAYRPSTNIGNRFYNYSVWSNRPGLRTKCWVREHVNRFVTATTMFTDCPWWERPHVQAQAKRVDIKSLWAHGQLQHIHWFTASTC